MDDFPFTAYAVRYNKPTKVTVHGREDATPFRFYLVDDGDQRFATACVFATAEQAAAEQAATGNAFRRALDL
jgi:hypothetical protein